MYYNTNQLVLYIYQATYILYVATYIGGIMLRQEATWEENAQLGKLLTSKTW